MMSTSSSGSTSVGRFPTRMRGRLGASSRLSSGFPNPGAAARQPTPLNTFLYTLGAADVDAEAPAAADDDAFVSPTSPARRVLS